MDREETGVIAQFSTFLARKGRRAWNLTVVEKTTVSPHMIRLRFSGADLHELEWKHGQDLVLEIPSAGGIARRHYTIRQLDAAQRTLDIDFVLHGAGPAGDWAANANAGDGLVAVGPRGHTYLRDADWHLFAGDETAIPGIYAMLESLPPSARAYAFLEIGSDEDRIALQTKAHAVVEWVSRGGAPAGPGTQLFDRVEKFHFPDGAGFAYVIGQTASVRAIRQRLVARGLAKDRIAAEGYWRPGRVGGHDHV